MPRLVLKLVGWLVLLYLLIFIPSFLIEEARLALTPDVVYIANDAPNSIYTEAALHAVYGVRKLDNYPDQIFIVGGSTAAKAFQPLDLMKDVPGYKVHNLAINGSNVTEMSQIVDIIGSHVDIRHLHSAVFVLNGQFSTFLDNQREFRDAQTVVDRERLRFHLYRLDKGQVVPVLAEPALTVALFLARPFIWLYTVKYTVSNALQDMRERFAALSQTEKEQEPSAKISFYKSYWQMLFQDHGVTEDQFFQFSKLVDQLVAMKATVVYVDLPVPSYLRKDLSFYADYRQHVKQIADNSSVHYLDLSDWAPDDHFSDDIHPKSEFCAKWSDKLAQYLRTVIVQPKSQPRQ